ncbi:SMC-Scp complex subunit ScpB [Amycolatopsis sp. 3B14]|uniref:SMC-Scp complex subunit ScpB n=1 Tax=Amycolatopsis sp. 3B14 TaxID=3243600 RepID=UPI003D987461
MSPEQEPARPEGEVAAQGEVPSAPGAEPGDVAEAEPAREAETLAAEQEPADGGSPSEEAPAPDAEADAAPAAQPAEPRPEVAEAEAVEPEAEAVEPEVAAEEAPSAPDADGAPPKEAGAAPSAESAEPPSAEAEEPGAEQASGEATLPPEDAPLPDYPEEPDEDLVAVGDGLPDLTEHSALAAALEALLLVVDSPVSEEALASALGQPEPRVTQTLQVMAAELTERGSGIDLRRAGEGWRLYTRDTYAPFVEKLLLDGQRSKLTRAALETLAVIAYRQPVTRSRVAAVRGVNVDGVIRTLLARGLIEENGADPETGGTLYVTTELFLERLGLSSLTDLPPIAPLLPEVDSIDDI